MMTTQASNELTALMDRLPDLDKEGKLTGPEPDKADAVFDELLAGGKDRIRELVDLLVPPGEGSDWKVRYVLHGLAVHVAPSDRAKQRDVLVNTLTSELHNDHPAPVKTFIIQQLQVVGGREVTGDIGAMLVNEALCEPATQALLAIRDGAVEQFRPALPRVKGKSRVTIIQALGVLRDAESVSAIASFTGDDDTDVRVATIWALGNIGEPAAIEAVLIATEKEQGYAKIAAAKAALLMAERCIEQGLGGRARSIYKHLKQNRTDPSEQYLRDAADRGLEAIEARG